MKSFTVFATAAVLLSSAIVLIKADFCTPDTNPINWDDGPDWLCRHPPGPNDELVLSYGTVNINSGPPIQVSYFQLSLTVTDITIDGTFDRSMTCLGLSEVVFDMGTTLFLRRVNFTSHTCSLYGHFALESGTIFEPGQGSLGTESGSLSMFIDESSKLRLRNTVLQQRWSTYQGSGIIESISGTIGSPGIDIYIAPTIRTEIPLYGFLKLEHLNTIPNVTLWAGTVTVGSSASVWIRNVLEGAATNNGRLVIGSSSVVHLENVFFPAGFEIITV